MHITEHIYQGDGIEHDSQQQAHPCTYFLRNQRQDGTEHIEVEEEFGGREFIRFCSFQMESDFRLCAEIAQSKHKDEEGAIHAEGSPKES